MSRRCGSSPPSSKHTTTSATPCCNRAGFRRPSNSSHRRYESTPIMPTHTSTWEMSSCGRGRSRKPSPTTEQALRIKPDLAEAHSSLGPLCIRPASLKRPLTLPAGAGDQARFRRCALQSGERFGASGSSTGGHPALPASAEVSVGFCPSEKRAGATASPPVSITPRKFRPQGSQTVQCGKPCWTVRHGYFTRRESQLAVVRQAGVRHGVSMLWQSSARDANLALVRDSEGVSRPARPFDREQARGESDCYRAAGADGRINGGAHQGGIRHRG